MNKKLSMICGSVALFAGACSDNNVSGTSVEPNTVADTVGDLWNPQAGEFAVNTARYAYAESWPKNAVGDGRWFWEMQTDAVDGGESYIAWPVELGTGADSLAPVVDACGGICGTAVLEKGTLTYSPFVGVGFSIATNDVGEPIPVDVSNWGGLCISYASEAAPTLVLDLGPQLELEFGYALPSVNLPKSGSFVTRCYEWRDFKFPMWADSYIPENWMLNAGEMAAKQLVAIRFRIQAFPGEFKFNITSLGTLGERPLSYQQSSSFVNKPDM